MKKSRRTKIMVLLSCLSFSAVAGPFGLEQGMSLQQLIKIAQVQEISKSVFLVKSLPMGSAEVDKYVLLIAPNVGLCKVTAMTKPITTDSSGSELKAEFTSYVNILAEKYGPVTKKMNFLHANTIWKDAKYWMRSLQQEEREMSYYWISGSNNKLADSIEAIDLSANAASQTLGYLTVAYEFKNMKKCQEALESEGKREKKGNLKNF